eukprot:1244866-Rhodomonas_salina.2
MCSRPEDHSPEDQAHAPDLTQAAPTPALIPATHPRTDPSNSTRAKQTEGREPGGGRGGGTLRRQQRRRERGGARRWANSRPLALRCATEERSTPGCESTSRKAYAAHLRILGYSASGLGRARQAHNSMWFAALTSEGRIEYLDWTAVSPRPTVPKTQSAAAAPGWNRAERGERDS